MLNRLVPPDLIASMVIQIINGTAAKNKMIYRNGRASRASTGETTEVASLPGRSDAKIIVLKNARMLPSFWRWAHGMGDCGIASNAFPHSGQRSVGRPCRL